MSILYQIRQSLRDIKPGSRCGRIIQMNTLLYRWHSALGMPKYDLQWHQADMADELQEYREATGLIDVWSELSDVTYTYTRAVWSGHTAIAFPLHKTWLYVGVIYMIPKYTLRWRFFRKLGTMVHSKKPISEVRNPKKAHKINDIAAQYNIDPDLFQAQATKLSRRSFFLP